MPTTALQAYRAGVAARAANPAATTWEGVLPFSGPPLAGAWLDGWYGRWADRLGDLCAHCWSFTLTDLPDGTVRCRSSPCRERHYPPVDRAKVGPHLAARDAGAFI